MADSPVLVEGLDHLLHDLRNMDLTIDYAVTTALAEAKERWKEDIRGTGQPPGGDKTWPIGTTRKSQRLCSSDTLIGRNCRFLFPSSIPHSAIPKNLRLRLGLR